MPSPKSLAKHSKFHLVRAASLPRRFLKRIFKLHKLVSLRHPRSKKGFLHPFIPDKPKLQPSIQFPFISSNIPKSSPSIRMAASVIRADPGVHIRQIQVHLELRVIYIRLRALLRIRDSISIQRDPTKSVLIRENVSI